MWRKDGCFAAANLDVEIRIGRGTTDVLAKLTCLPRCRPAPPSSAEAVLGGLMHAATEGPVPCRELFARGQRHVEVVGPLLEEEAAAAHAGFWNHG
jgi:hypothetical protein